MLNTKMIGNKITIARKRLNISQAQLAQKLFISSQAVGKWERGESMPDIITLNRLSEILGVDLNYFSEDKDPVENEIIPAEFSENIPQKLPSEPKEKPQWDMSRGNWVDADFSGLKNLNEKFSSSNMQRCMFLDSDLSRLTLKSNQVNGCDFSGSRINRSNIQNSYLENNKFKACSLRETEFSGSYIKGCDFSGADFSGVKLKSGGFQKNIITDVLWNRTSFIGMYIDDIIFDGTLEDCYFENCAFKKVTFQNATIINTFFKNKSLKQIRFIDCQADKLTYEFLKNGKADLTGVTLLPL